MDSNIPQKKKLEDTTPSASTNPPVFVVPSKNSLEETLSHKEFRIPKKPEEPREPIKIENFAQKNGINLLSKEFGSKTMTPSEEIDVEKLVRKNTTASALIERPLQSLPDSPPSTEEDMLALPNLRTYKKDVAGSIKDQKTSLIRMVLEDQRKKIKNELNESPESKKNLPLIIFSLIFFLLSVSIVYYAFFTNKDPASEIFTKLNITPIVRTENTKEIIKSSQTPKEFSHEIKKELTNNNSKLDTIEYIYFTEKYIVPTSKGDIESSKILKASSLFEDLEIPIPSKLLRSLKSDYMFGFHNFNGNQPFLILKTDYYDTAFSGMLDWEPTLLKDIAPLFATAIGENIENRSWGDIVIKSKDMRILKDFNEKTVLVYMFKDPNTLIISTSENTIFEVSTRMDTLLEKK